MSLQSDYLKAVLPNHARILGQRLRPLSLGHIVILTRYGSPFLTGDRQPMFGDLCFAVWACKRTWEQCKEGIAASSYKRDIRFLKWVSAFKNKHRAIVLFSKYLANSLQEPELFYNKVDNGKPTSMAHLQYMKIVLVTKMHKTVSEAMDTAFAEAIYDLAAIGEGEGVCGFVSDETHIAADVARRNHERRKKAELDGQRN